MFDPLIRAAVASHFPDLREDFGAHGWLWVKAQMWQESRFDMFAVSPAGAVGLLQLMPGTARDLGVVDPLDPAQNVNGGVRYLAEQFNHLREIPSPLERLRMAFAAYNGGRGYVNAALALGRKLDGLPENFSAWMQAGRPRGEWQKWYRVAELLSAVEVKGKKPDVRQILHYVDVIEARFNFYLAGESK